MGDDLPQAPAEGDPADIRAPLQTDGTYRVALKPGRYVVEVTVDKYCQRDFSPPNVGDEATDSDIIPTFAIPSLQCRHCE